PWLNPICPLERIDARGRKTRPTSVNLSKAICYLPQARIVTQVLCACMTYTIHCGVFFLFFARLYTVYRHGVLHLHRRCGIPRREKQKARRVERRALRFFG